MNKIFHKTIIESSIKGSFIKNIKTQNNNTIKKKERKIKPNYFSDIFQEKLKIKNKLSIKTSSLALKNPVSSKESTYSIPNSNIDKVIIDPKKFIKSQILKNFKNFKPKNLTNSGDLISHIKNTNSSSIEIFSIDTLNNVNSTKSNSFASSFSRSNTAFSNSLKNHHFKSNFSSNNTEISLSSSLKQIKDIPKFSRVKIEEKKTNALTCNVVISLNPVKNKKFVSSFIENDCKKKFIIKKVNTKLNKK